MRKHANGIDVHVEVNEHAGAPWLLCIHSLATDLSIWDRFVADVGEQRSIIRYDLRGHGSTEVTPPPYSLELLLADAVGVLDACDVAVADVVGLSIGGMLAMGMAINHPDRCRKVVVADARAASPAPYAAVWDEAIADATSGRFDAVIERSAERWFSKAFRDSSPEAVRALQQRALRTPLDGFVGAARAVQKVNYLDGLASVRNPCYFLTGLDDPAAPPDTMRDMAARTPGARFQAIPGGHLTPLESPEEFSSAVIPFLLGKRT